MKLLARLSRLLCIVELLNLEIYLSAMEVVLATSIVMLDDEPMLMSFIYTHQKYLASKLSLYL